MSWFSEIAGKAEDLLNKVDKKAAAALQNKKFGSAADIRVKTDHRSLDSFEASLSSSKSEIFNYNPLAAGNTNKKVQRPYSSPRKKPESDDEKLLQYLNSSEQLPAFPDHQMSKEKESERKMDLTISSESPSEAIVPTKDTTSTTSVSPNVPDEDFKIKSEVEIKIDPDPSEEIVETFDKTTTVDVIQNEIQFTASKNDLERAAKRAEHAESEMKRMQKKLEHWNSQISGNDKHVRELQNREADLIAALDAKDSQLAVLKVRLVEADSELQGKRQMISDIKAENERLVKSLATESQQLNQTIDALKNSLGQAETELGRSKEDYQTSQNEQLFRMSKAEEEQRHLAETVTTLQRKCSEQNERYKDLTNQLQASNRSLESLQHEYADYKQKAQRILQSKEKLIASLKEGNYDGEKSSEGESSLSLLTSEMEGIKQERDMLRDELRKTSEMLESSRNDVQELEKMAHSDANAAREHCRYVDEQLHEEKLSRDKIVLMNAQLKEEMQFLKENLSRTTSSFQTRIQDREVEIDKLRKQLTAKSLSTVSQDELESRLHALTENLIQKQTIVEALSTEKNSLVLQLERLEQQLKEAQMYSSQSHTVVGVNSSESERKQKLFLENPFDSHLTRRVKHVYGSIDALSIRMGVFFRRYPIARMFIIIYMFLLHFWVMIVLLTYEPEIHHSP